MSSYKPWLSSFSTGLSAYFMGVEVTQVSGKLERRIGDPGSPGLAAPSRIIVVHDLSLTSGLD